jgi:putative endonuclease
METELTTSRERLDCLWNWLARRQRLSLGSWGEWIALRYLLRRQYDVLARNWRIGRGELDLIAYQGPSLVIIEVKTRRRSPLDMSPEFNLTEAKMTQLEYLAHAFVGRHEMVDVPVRFDLIAIETEDLREYELRHYKGFM